jgi:TolA-binding protein
LVLIAAALAADCAYYNTFYTAKKHYKAAEQAHEASGQEHPSPSVLGLYQSSIEKSQKVITNYPTSKWVDDARYLIAMAHMKREEYDESEKRFEDLIGRHPDSKLVPDAYLGIGLCRLGRGDWEEARLLLEQVLVDYPDFERRGEVLFQLSKSAAKRREYQQAIRGFTDLLAGDAGGVELEEVYRERGEAYFQLEAPDSALGDFVELAGLETQPESRLKAELRVGECLELLGRHQEALDRYARLERELPQALYLPRIQLRRAHALNDMGEHEAAIGVYKQVAEDFSVSVYAAEANYQTGFTQEIYLGDVESAKESYAKVQANSPGSEFASLAEERRQSLELFGQYRSEIAESGEEEKAAEASLLLAELSLFRLRKIDEALAAYQAVERDQPNSSLAPKAAYAVAWIQEHELGDSLAALASYRHVHETYSDTEYGVEAGVRAGLLDADSLSIHLGRVLRIKAVEDSLVAVARAREEQARADSLAAIGGELLAAAAGDSLAAIAGADSLAARAAVDSLATAAAVDSLAAAAAVDSLAARAVRDSVAAGGAAGSRASRGRDSLLVTRPRAPFGSVLREEHPDSHRTPAEAPAPPDSTHIPPSTPPSDQAVDSGGRSEVR